MRDALALIRVSWQAAKSYRMRLILSLASLGATVVPLYFVAGALQPVMADSIALQGDHYFGFLIVGMVTFLLLPSAVNSLPSEISSGISTGFLETLLGTPAKPASIFGGMIGFNMFWTVLRATALLFAGWLLGANLMWSQIASSALILTLIVLAYLPIGMIGAALVICFRTSGPLGQAVLGLSALLGGVYYPTTVIPSWIQSLSAWVPLTYGLRALRRNLLEGDSFLSVMPDVASLAAFAVGLTAVGVLALSAALGHARRAGNLAHY